MSLSLVSFEKWEIDYVGEVHLYFSKEMAYIVVITKFLTTWSEAKVVVGAQNFTEIRIHFPYFIQYM